MAAVTSHGLSRRALFGLGHSRLGERLDAAGEVPAAPRAPAAPTLAEVAARWEAARTPKGQALWSPVQDALDAAVRDVVGDDRDGAATSVFGPQSTPGTRMAIAALFETVQPRGPQPGARLPHRLQTRLRLPLETLGAVPQKTV